VGIHPRHIAKIRAEFEAVERNLDRSRVKATEAIVPRLKAANRKHREGELFGDGVGSRPIRSRLPELDRDIHRPPVADDRDTNRLARPVSVTVRQGSPALSMRVGICDPERSRIHWKTRTAAALPAWIIECGTAGKFTPGL
jgi:hypothetical protein